MQLIATEQIVFEPYIKYSLWQYYTPENYLDVFMKSNPQYTRYQKTVTKRVKQETIVQKARRLSKKLKVNQTELLQYFKQLS